MKILKSFLLSIIIILFLNCSSVNAQRKTEIGLTASAARFYPRVESLGSSLNNKMENGWGWTAGIFIEEHWKGKIHQIIEINYYCFYSNVFLEKIPNGGGYGSNIQPVIGNYQNTDFNQIALSGGLKYFLNNTLFVYPAFEIGFSLNSDIDINKTVYSVKLGIGVELGNFDLILEYDYGLTDQRMVFDPTVPFAATYRNSYLQIKAQIPLYNLRK